MNPDVLFFPLAFVWPFPVAKIPNQHLPKTPADFCGFWMHPLENLHMTSITLLRCELMFSPSTDVFFRHSLSLICSIS